MTPPTLQVGRCVHSRSEIASCRACIQACPLGAWKLSDESLELDATRCDGCGLCVAACPTGAVTGLAHDPVRRLVAGRVALLAACERVQAETGEGRVPCLHGIGLTPLLQAWTLGRRIWLVASADCDACPRGAAERLETRIERLNGLFQARGQALIHLRRLGGESLAALLDRCEPVANGSPADRGKRNWLGLGGRTQQPAETDAVPAPGAYFPGKGPLPWVVELDPVRCVACHACERLCPTGVLSWEELEQPARDEPDACYRLEHIRCTGCGLCSDVCEHAAIQPIAWTRPVRDAVLFHSGKCPGCGNRFYHAGVGDSAAYCWVCARSGSAQARSRTTRIVADD